MTQNNLIFRFFQQESTPGTLLGIDYGAKRIGLAVYDRAYQTSRPLFVIHKLNELDVIIPKYHITGAVIGYPLQPDGTEGATVHQVNLFADRVAQKYHIPILFIDERFSSVRAQQRQLYTLPIRIKRLNANLDTYVACQLLDEVMQSEKLLLSN